MMVESLAQGGVTALPLLSIAGLLVIVLAAALGLGVGWWFAARSARGLVSRAADEAKRILQTAEAEAGKSASERLADLDQEIAARRETWEEDERKRLQALEESEDDADRRHRRLVDRDRALTRRDQLLSQREQEMERRRLRQNDRAAEIERLHEQMMVRLEEVSGMTREAARRQLLDELRAEVRQSASSEVRTIKDEIQRNAESEAQKIMALAMERLASDFSAQRSVSYVKLPDASLRGRVIGSEGRNIRAFENLTGMQLLLDDDPLQVTISGFHPVNREIARRALEKLVASGVIHPKKIQQVVAGVRRKVEQEIQRAGKEAAREFGLNGINAELVLLLGRLKFRTSYGQPVLDHVREVAHLCGMMAVELGLDQRLAQRAALLHDIGKAVDFEREGTHPEIGGEIARRCGEHEVVVNAIESHHDDCEVIHPISALVAAADALSGARPGARRSSTVDYMRRVAKLEQIGASLPGVESCYALQAGREVRVIVQPKKVSDDDAALLAHDLSQRIQNEVDYPGRIKVTVIRAVRAQATAR